MTKYEDIKVIILAGNRDFGRYPLATKLPVALWPITDKPAIEHLVDNLVDQGIVNITVCSNGDAETIENAISCGKSAKSAKFNLIDEKLPVGTAGCVRDAAKEGDEKLLVILPAGIVNPPNIDQMLQEHIKSGSDMTVMFNPSVDANGVLDDPAQIYVFARSVLQAIPELGYYDIKESMIPDMLKAGKTINAGRLSCDVGNFRSWPQYLKAVGEFLENADSNNPLLKGYEQNGSKNIWLGNNVEIDPGARILGPVVLGDNTKISKDVVILGPAVLGCDVKVAAGAFIADSVIWKGADVGRHCQIKESVVDRDSLILNHSVLENEAVVTNSNTDFASKTVRAIRRKFENMSTAAELFLDKINTRLPNLGLSNKSGFGTFQTFGLLALVAVFVWSYWATIVDLWQIWQRSDEYSIGMLVPFLAVYILWSRRDKISQCPVKPSMIGMFGYIFAQAFRFFGLFFMYGSAERLSFVISIISLVILIFGWSVIRRIYAVLLFLFLMLPLPARVHSGLMLPLQNMATESAVFCLELIGYPVIKEGNVIHINDTSVAVAEACNGLRMVMSFIVIVSLVVLIVRQPFWKKLILMISGIPIALLCNTIRLTVTSVIFTKISGEQWEKFFHDFGGYAMMPVALLIVIAELWILTKLTTPPEEKIKS